VIEKVVVTVTSTVTTTFSNLGSELFDDEAPVIDLEGHTPSICDHPLDAHGVQPRTEHTSTVHRVGFPICPARIAVERKVSSRRRLALLPPDENPNRAPVRSNSTGAGRFGGKTR
jgi:hypothetical protein